jgi:hypothetical protein
MVDSTPPVPGQVSVHFFNNAILPSHDVVVQWKDFIDPESGIVGYEVGVGSTSGSQDVSLFTPVSGSNHIFDDVSSMQDGKYYYFQIKVFNNMAKGITELLLNYICLYNYMCVFLFTCRLSTEWGCGASRPLEQFSTIPLLLYWDMSALVIRDR